MAYFPREINFLVAAVSTKNKWLNFFLKLVNFIPTRRPQDEIYAGTGKITSVKGSTLKGQGTNFTKTLSEKSTVIFGSPKVELFVKKVLDDETLEIDNSKGVELEAEVDFKVLPKVDQAKMFDNCWKLLAKGQVVGIFPEGGSHDQLGLLPIKAGVGIIYMGAIEKYNADVQVMACGINYDNGHKFRSTAILEYGVPYKMPDEEVHRYKIPEQKKEVVNDFLQLISKIHLISQ
jgi:glycerol-3-phosphate O-acyltransferase/dihydroxyacetone phosphate acyltransferase